jgi:Putative stress-responsive transcriptional regulator
MKYLYRSRTNKKICGVCGGIAEYLELDPTVIRVLWILLCCMGGLGIFGYFMLALIMPSE